MSKHNIFACLTFLSLIICSCSTNPNNLLVIDKKLTNGLNESQQLDEGVKEEYLNAKSAFYQQKFVEDKIGNDSSFCGFYEPRKINEDSIIPLFDYGRYDDTLILTFMINGFYLNKVDINGLVTFKGDDLFFEKEITDNITFNKFLIPQVFKNGNIYDIKEAYANQIIGKEVFDYLPNSDGYYLRPKNENCLFEINKTYFNNLPTLVNYPKSNCSLLLDEFQNVKNIFYNQEFKNKNYNNDKMYRDLYVSDEYRKYCIEVDVTSIHINLYKKFPSGIKLYIISINDIFRELKNGWLDEPIIHQYRMGDLIIDSDYIIEPVLEINNQIVFITRAYNKNLLTSEMILEIDNYCGHNGLYLSYYTHKEDFVENKLLERQLMINKITIN